jgi:hypothetical protein
MQKYHANDQLTVYIALHFLGSNNMNAKKIIKKLGFGSHVVSIPQIKIQREREVGLVPYFVVEVSS